MELRQVRYFVAVLDAGGFTAAAQSLSIVQSAVSQQISRLERELGTELFDRSRRSVHPTEAGRRFEPFARSMLDTEEAARRALTPRGAQGPVRIGVPTGLGALLAATVNALPPGALPGPVEIVDATSSERERRVAEGDLDAAVIRTSPVRGDLVAYALPADELVVVGAADHRAFDATTVTLTDLGEHPLLFSVGAVGNPVYANTVAACRRVGVEPRLQILPQDVAVLSSLTTVSNSWTVFFATHARQFNAETLGVRFVPSTEPLEVAKSIVVRRDRTDLGARIAAAINDEENR